jgi:hypothetical protein
MRYDEAVLEAPRSPLDRSLPDWMRLAMAIEKRRDEYDAIVTGAARIHRAARLRRILDCDTDSVFLNARLARLGPDATTRSVGMIGAAQLVVCANQLYGDMGIFSHKTMYTMAVSYAIVLKMPRFAGVWDVQPAALPARSAGRGARSAWPSSSSYRSSS